MTHRIRVLVPVPIEAGGGVYDYLTGDMSVGIGDYVAVPLGKRVVPGVVWDVPHGAADNDLPLDRLKQIQQRYDVPPMGGGITGFDRMAAYTVTPPGAWRCRCWRRWETLNQRMLMC